MKIKLAVIDRAPAAPIYAPPRYFVSEGRLRAFRYAPACCPRGEETVFA